MSGRSSTPVPDSASLAELAAALEAGRKKAVVAEATREALSGLAAEATGRMRVNLEASDPVVGSSTLLTADDLVTPGAHLSPAMKKLAARLSPAVNAVLTAADAVAGQLTLTLRLSSVAPETDDLVVNWRDAAEPPVDLVRAGSLDGPWSLSRPSEAASALAAAVAQLRATLREVNAYAVKLAIRTFRR